MLAFEARELGSEAFPCNTSLCCQDPWSAESELRLPEVSSLGSAGTKLGSVFFLGWQEGV